MCRKFDLRVDGIWGENGEAGKIVADCYIDDRAYHFGGDWRETAANVLDYYCVQERRR